MGEKVMPLFCFLLFVVALACCHHSMRATAEAEAVLDRNGNPVMANKSYAILVVRDDGPDPEYLTYAFGCTVVIGQGLGPKNAVTFHPSVSDVNTVMLDDNLNVVFSSSPGPECRGTPLWRLKRISELDPIRTSIIRYLEVGGELGNPGRKTVDNWFKITKHQANVGEHMYMFLYDPTVCRGAACPGVTSSNVSVFEDYYLSVIGLIGKGRITLTELTVSFVPY